MTGSWATHSTLSCRSPSKAILWKNKQRTGNEPPTGYVFLGKLVGWCWRKELLNRTWKLEKMKKSACPHHLCVEKNLSDSCGLPAASTLWLPVAAGKSAGISGTPRNFWGWENWNRHFPMFPLTNPLVTNINPFRSLITHPTAMEHSIMPHQKKHWIPWATIMWSNIINVISLPTLLKKKTSIPWVTKNKYGPTLYCNYHVVGKLWLWFSTSKRLPMAHREYDTPW